MNVEMWPIDRPRPYERNPRRNDAAVDYVAKSIKEFGFRVPIVVDAEGVVIAGHTRLKAAQRLGLAEVPVHVARDLSPDQARALRIADNKVAEKAEWDDGVLRHELSALAEMGFNLDTLGFDDDELASAMFEDYSGSGDPDAIPDPPNEAVTKRGDVIVMGDHRLMCGDSASRDDMDMLIEDCPVDMVNTDPPYNVKVEPRSRKAIAAGNSSFEAPKTRSKESGGRLRAKDRPLMNDFVTDAAFDEMMLGWFGNIGRVLRPGGGFYIWGGYSNCANYPPVLHRCGLKFSQAIIWIKGHPVMTRKDFMGNHEWCFYGWKEGGPHKFYGARNIQDTWELLEEPVAVDGEEYFVGLVKPEALDGVPSDVWRVKKIPPQKMVHLTEKPVELARRAIEYSSKIGQTVLDLFGGSGSTLIAAQMTGRRARLMELDPLYCDVIVQRFEDFTKQKAVRLS